MGVGKVIGKQLNNGFPGSFAIQPDMLIASRLNVDTSEIIFGDLCMYKSDMSGVEHCNETNQTNIETHFAGIATRIVKQSDKWNDQSNVGYNPKESVSVFQRGMISILCVEGTPKLNGKVYYRYKTNDADAKPIGFTAQEDANTDTKTVLVSQLVFAGEADTSGIVAVSINEKHNA